jgi:UDP-2,3-diacylglucosamine pyrophosphatase LpxH
MDKFVFLTDLHYGYERNQSRHKVSLHDPKALNVALQFIHDFKPDHIILGGDTLDCGSISHHRKGVTGKLEGLRLLAEAKELKKVLLDPLESMVEGRLVYMIGNHEDWLSDLVDEMPSLEGIVDIKSILGLSDRWEVVAQGKVARLGKLNFIHGDTIKGGQNHAMWAVTTFERNIRYGHFHTFQVATKTTPTDLNGHTGIAVPCLCKKNPGYMEGSPNRWVQGFQYGFVRKDGSFSDYTAIICNGKAIINGTAYNG